MQHLSGLDLRGLEVPANFPGRAVHQVGRRLTSQAQTGTVLSSFGLRGFITSADQDRNSEGTKELPVVMQPGESHTDGRPRHLACKPKVLYTIKAFNSSLISHLHFIICTY